MRGIMGWARPIFLEKRGGPKENFTMVGGGSLHVLLRITLDHYIMQCWMSHVAIQPKYGESEIRALNINKINKHKPY